jgi:conjugative relaxase-like TrwC/TraI family protein
VLSIGKLAPGPQAAAYFLERVGCPLDYFVGRGEAAGVWLGRGATALGLRGGLDGPQPEETLRRLLAGQGPDGTELVKPVLRGDPRGRVPAAVVAGALQAAATRRGVEVAELLRPAMPVGADGADGATGRSAGGARRVGAAGEELLRVWERTVAELDRARRRPHWPAPSLPAEMAQRMLQTAGLDPAAVLAERTPTGRLRDVLARAIRHRDDRVDVRLPGLDLTLSAPKSVSLLWALSGVPEHVDPEHREHELGDEPVTGVGGGVGEQVREAHRVAVREALEYLELTCTDALRGHHRGDGTDRRVATDGLIGAAFEHRSSRCGDPQLHTHVVVANLLHGGDGKWSALNTREIYAQARTAGFVYQTVLRGELTRRLGVTWTPVRNGQAEIAGMPPELLRLFSKRRRQIEAQLEQLGLDSTAAAQAATLDTRPAKPEPPGLDEAGEPVRLQDRWRAEAAAAGHLPDRLASVLHRPEAAAAARRGPRYRRGDRPGRRRAG